MPTLEIEPRMQKMVESQCSAYGANGTLDKFLRKEQWILYKVIAKDHALTNTEGFLLGVGIKYT